MMSYAQWGNELYSGKRSYNIVGKRKLWILTGIVLLILSCLLIVYPSISPSIEFKGGTEFSVSGLPNNDQKPAASVTRSLPQANNAKLSSLGTNGVRVQTATMTTAQSREMVQQLAKAYKIPEGNIAATTIGPAWGKEVTDRALKSLGIFALLVAIVLTLYFKTWTMAFSALFALLHDTLFTAAAFALTQVEVSPATVIGVLTILGYSLYDTVVVFDKVRELTVKFYDQSRYTYAELVNLAVNQTMVRSINTSIVGLLPVSAILFVSSVLLGGGTLRDISMALFIGMVVGTWSSIFIASPMLVTLRMREKKLQDHTQRVFRRRRLEEDDVVAELSKKKLPKKKRKQILRQQVESMEFEDDEDSIVAQPLKAGGHRGHQAQPRKKPRSKR
ncbi:MAG: protein translocase subunit SecF [Actinomycetaceae bacterium]|nr:protein translocase subunit SecF [Actinomycetaceae bacterium]